MRPNDPDWPKDADGRPLNLQDIQDWFDQLCDEYPRLPQDEVILITAMSLHVPAHKLRSILILE